MIDRNEVSEIDAAFGDDPGDRRPDLGEGQLACRVIEGQLGLVELILGIDEGLLADQFLVKETLLTVEFPLPLVHLALRLGQGRALFLVLEVDQELALADCVAFFDEQIDDAAGGLGIDLDVAFGLQGCGETQRGLNQALFEGFDLDGNGLDLFLAVFPAAAVIGCVVVTLDRASCREHHYSQHHRQCRF